MADKFYPAKVRSVICYITLRDKNSSPPLLVTRLG